MSNRSIVTVKSDTNIRLGKKIKGNFVIDINNNIIDISIVQILTYIYNSKIITNAGLALDAYLDNNHVKCIGVPFRNRRTSSNILKYPNFQVLAITSKYISYG